MLEVYRETVRLIEAGRRGAVATVVATSGSTPAKETAKLLVRDDGSTVGTVGGGCSEADVWRRAMEVIATDRPARMSFRLTAATAAETGLLCGGEFEVFIEPVGNPTIMIFGAGHCARSLAPLLQTLDYRVVVVDDRESFVQPEHFPPPTELAVRDFEQAFADLPVGPNTYIVVMTRGHEHDETVLRQAVLTEARYVGLLGSKGKIGAIRKNLRRQGIPDERLARVRAPVGIAIDSRTPAEIAVSVAAEIIAFRRGRLPEDSPQEKGEEDPSVDPSARRTPS